MIKIVILMCRLTLPGACTQENAAAVILADRQDDGTPCMALGHLLLKQLHKNPDPDPTVMTLVACQKDGHPFY
jgi:hypothetical protein